MSSSANGGGGGNGNMSDVNNSPSSSSASSSKNTGDSLFEPSVEMMVDDFDDERTLEEEEALAEAEADDPNAELSNLQKEGDMPIEELLALYNCSAPMAMHQTSTSKSKHTSRNNKKNSVATTDYDDGESVGGGGGPNDGETDEPDEDDDASQLRKLYPETYAHHSDQRLLRDLSRQASDDDDDGDYSLDDDDYKKTIMVGSEFQAQIPEGMCRYDDALPYENDDKLLWDPSKLSENEIEDYLFKSYTTVTTTGGTNSNLLGGASNSSNMQNISGGSSSSSHASGHQYAAHLNAGGKHLKDDEQALYLLLQCGQNIEEALRRRRINSSSISSQTTSDGMSLWSEEECRNFENGLRTFGKDFHSIQKSKVRTRSVGELVQFYYLWKKTERHDAFANKARLEKKKYNLHPGVTDYMDRFLEEQENGSGTNSNSSLNNQVNSSSSSSVSSSERINNNNTNNFGGGGLGVVVSGNNITYRARSSSPGGVNCFLYSDAKQNSNHSIHRMRNNINNSSSNNHENINNGNLAIIHTNNDQLAGGNMVAGGGDHHDNHITNRSHDHPNNRNSIYNSENNTNILNSGGKASLLGLSNNNSKFNDSHVHENKKFL